MNDKNKPKLSVIVPVFNADIELFSACLNSISASTLKDMEVIVVDDGSTIDYTEIIRTYPNFRFLKIENSGTLHARLYGLSVARGEYVYFMDADDAISFDYLEAMLTKAQSTNADIVLNDWAFWTHNSKYVCTLDSTITSNFDTHDDALTKFFSSSGAEHSYYVMWNKIFRRELLLKVKDELEKLNLGKMVYAEDVLTSFFAFSLAKTIANTHCGYYFYRLHDSQQVYVDSREKFINQIDSLSQVFSIFEKYLKEIGRFDDFSANLIEWKTLLCSNQLSVARHSHFNDLREHILTAYGFNSAPRKRKNADRPYSKHKLLPKNIDEVEEFLSNLYNLNTDEKIYCKARPYLIARLNKMNQYLDKSFVLSRKRKYSTIIPPREIYPIKLKILHNNFVYKIGTFLFPKGSKIRKLLKSKF